MGVEEPRLIRLDSDEPEEHVLPEGETRIGRSRASAICLRESTVSRFHCYLVRKGDKVRVFEGKSKNPARLNGDPVSGQVLRTGQVLVVGKAEFVYQGAVAEKLPSPVARPSTPTSLQPAAPQPPVSPPRPALSPRRPPGAARARRSHPARAREPAWIAAGVLIVAAPVVVWLVVSGIPSAVERSETKAVRPGPEEADLASEIQARIALIEKSRDAELERASARSAKKIDDLSAQLVDLHAELERLRARPPGTSETSPRAAPAEPPSRRPSDPGKLHGKFSIPEDQPRDEPTTVVVPRKPERVRRGLEEVREIKERLRRQVEDYATHVVTPAVLAPDLEKLVMTENREAAAALLDLEKHARALLRETDLSIEENRKRKDVLLERARSAAPPPASSEAGRSKKYTPERPGRETDQRWLDACEKAMQIHRDHREHLAPLRVAILQSIGKVSAPEGLDTLRARLQIDDDEDLALAIASAFEAAAWQESVPVLAQRLASARTDRLRGGLRKALASIAGEDLGDGSAAWLEWWRKRR